jgi:hypothetical protein
MSDAVENRTKSTKEKVKLLNVDLENTNKMINRSSASIKIACGTLVAEIQQQIDDL